MHAPRLLWRSILAEIMVHTALGLAVIGLLLLVQNLLRYLQDLVEIGFETGDLARLSITLLPTYLPYAIPTALLFGILLTFGRMSADGEVVALRASGVGVSQVLPPVLAAGALATALLGALLFEVEPKARMELKAFVRDLGSMARLALPGRFRKVGDRTLYVHGAGDESCPLEGVFLADFTRDEEPLYVAARCGTFGSEAEGGYLTLELVEGSVHFPQRRPERYRVLRFSKMQTHLDLTRYLAPGQRSRELSFTELLEADAAFRRGEPPQLRRSEGLRDVRIQIHRRIAFSLSCLVLAVLAVPLGVRPVRTGRSWGALVAITVMGGYWLLLTGGQIAAEAEVVSPAVGLWAGNAVVLTAAVVLVRRLRRVEV
jgi:lipopolysaccharide export system permease protein